MSLRILSHPWEVQDLEDALLVKITPRDLDVGTVSVLTDELFELAQESGQRCLSLDFAEVHVLPSMVVGKLFALDRRLREVGGQLFLCNLEPSISELLQAESCPGGWTDEPPTTREEGRDCFVVFVRDGSEPMRRPEAVERPVARCPTYEEAVRVREDLRAAGKNCVIRFVGETGGGD